MLLPFVLVANAYHLPSTPMIEGSQVDCKLLVRTPMSWKDLPGKLAPPIFGPDSPRLSNLAKARSTRDTSSFGCVTGRVYAGCTSTSSAAHIAETNMSDRNRIKVDNACFQYKWCRCHTPSSGQRDKMLLKKAYLIVRAYRSLKRKTQSPPSQRHNGHGSARCYDRTADGPRVLCTTGYEHHPSRCGFMARR